MKTRVKISATFHCSLERAFKTPILCDITKIHSGYGPMPKVVQCTDDENWGQIGSSKKLIFAKSLTQKGGFGSVDHVIERIENKYWKIEVTDFQNWILGFYKFVGEWEVTELGQQEILINYTYTLYSRYVLAYPIHWLFTKIFWRKYMNYLLENVRQLTLKKEPYLYA